MQATARKIKLIYLPFLLMATGFIVLYTLLNWLLFVKMQLFPVKQSVLNFWLPFCLPWIPVLLWLRPRIGLLKLEGGNDRLPLLYQFIAALAMGIPAIIAQEYLERAAGSLTALENINQVNTREATKYYTLKHYYIDRSGLSLHVTFDVSGRHNENFNMHLYAVMPVLGSAADTAGRSCPAWLGLAYREQISNRLSRQEKENSYQAFMEKSQQDLKTRNVRQFVYLKRAGNTAEGDGFREAVKKSAWYVASAAPVLVGVNAPFEQRNGGRFGWIFKSFGLGAGIWFIMLLFPALDDKALKQYRLGGRSRSETVFYGLRPYAGYIITPLIIYINLLLFALMVLSGLDPVSFPARELLRWGANYRPFTTEGQWWRLLTSAFLHGSIMHLAANMLGLMFAGMMLEPLLGKARYLLVYLLCGIIASCASIWWHSATVSVGASGAIFGLYGTFLALLLTRAFPSDTGKMFLASILIFIGYNLLMGLQGGVDNAAHIAGLAAGMIAGLLLSPALKAQQAGRQS